MCRLTAYFGPPILVDDLLYRSERSVIRQSFDARERLGGSGGEVYEVGNLNADGFGLGWYRNEVAPDATSTPHTNDTFADHKENFSKVHEPCVFKDTGPAWLNRNLRNLARMIESRLVFAHVRAAGPGMSVCECSCHPFVYGRYMFMHNGSIGGFGQIRRRLMSRLSDSAYDFAIQNSCSDSAVAFALFISKLEDPFQQMSPNAMRRSLIQLVETICGEAEAASVKQISLLNFVLADGVNVAATRYVHKPSEHEKPTKAATLYFASGSKFEAESTKRGRKLERQLSQDGDCEAETFRMVRQDRRDKVVIITSEPLTNSRADWIPVPTNHILLITADPQILLSPVVVNVDSAPRLVRQVSSEFKQSVERNLAQGLANRPNSKDGFSEGAKERGISPFFVLSSGNDSAALSMAQCDGYLYSTGTGNVYTWDLKAWQCCAVTEVKTSRILALYADERRKLLFGSCSDNRVHIWTTEFMEMERRLQCVQHIEFPSIGHILDLCIIDDRLFTGSQDAMLRCVDNIYTMLGVNPTVPGLALTSSLGITEPPEEASQTEQCILHCQVCAVSPLSNAEMIQAPPKRLISHFGYIYALAETGKYIASAGGDGEIKLWSTETLTLVATLRGHQQAVLALVACEESNTLYSGSIDGTVRVWDIEMLACRRTLLCRDDVLSLALVSLPGTSLNKVLLSGTSGGEILIWSCASFEQLQVLSSSSGGAVCSIAVLDNSAICGGTTSGTIVAWRLSSIVADLTARGEGQKRSASSSAELVATEKAELLQVLREFVSIPSVSHEISTREDCWVAGRYISSVLEQFGCKVTVRTASAELGQGLPVIIGEFCCTGAEESVVIYGHYDVVSAEKTAWQTDPWKMQCIDGYLYGRGVTDDKGPIVAALFATKDLYEQGRLQKNVIFLLEGEEESGVGIHDRGFCQVIEDNIDLFNNTAAIVISNNYWIDDHRPCLTYGMRGVIDASVQVVGSAHGTLHAGVDGGPVYEPAEDLTSLLHALTTRLHEVVAPGVRENTEDENRRLDEANLDVEMYAKKIGVERLKCSNGRSVLEARWSKPSVSISSLTTTNATGTFRKIPAQAEAKISFHFVPDQSAKEQEEMLEAFLKKEFDRMGSGNQLRLRICQTSDWWLGRLENRVYSVAASAIEKVWGMKPVYVREGGSYGGITSFLETTLKAPAIHLPLGQSSDNAHLANERIRLHSLIQGKDVIENFLTEL